MSLSSVEIPRSKRHTIVEDRIPCIFRLGGGEMIAEKPGEFERDDEEGALGLEDVREVENVVSLQDTTILSLVISAQNFEGSIFGGVMAGMVCVGTSRR